MLTDANGSSTVTRYDYLPFGQELLASTNGRTTGMGYLGSPDGSNPKFTGKNRDNESGFDWFEVRHMSGAQGRFQSVDPGNAGAQPEDPQTWNAYSYVGNNPLSYTDPSGQGFWSGFLTFLIGSFGGNEFPPDGSGFPNIGDVNSGPWNEQVPSGIGSGGSVNTGGVFGDGNTGPFIFSECPAGGCAQAGTWYENLPTFPTWFVDVTAGAADAITFRITSKIRDRIGTNSVVNQCSGAYEGGALAPLVFGAGRLAYAGVAKLIPFAYGAAATEEGAYAAYSARETLKSVFNAGMKPLRGKTFGQLAAEKNGDWARIIRSSGKTSTGFNTAGATVTGGVIRALTGRPSSCR